MNYVRTLKRIRQDKTNYHKRAALILGRNSFVTIKVTDQNVACQLLSPKLAGDIVVASAHSRELEKLGWKGAFNNLPACYLTGLLLGKKALEKGINSAVLYIGKDRYTTRVAAALKGVVDSGIKIPVAPESLPPAERLTGIHIAEYASILKSDDQKYNSRFSAILKAGLKPEDYPSHFEEVRFKISGKPSELKPAEKKEKKEKPEAGKEKPKEKSKKGEAADKPKEKKEKADKKGGKGK